MIIILMLWGAVTEGGPAWGQIRGKDGDSRSRAVELPENLTYESIDDILSRLDDTQVRQLVLDLLQAEVDRRVSEQGRGGEAGRSIQEHIAHFGSRLKLMLSGSRALPDDLLLAFNYLTGRQGTWELIRSLLLLGIIMAVALMIERGVRRKTAWIRDRFPEAPEPAGRIKAGYILGRFLMDLGCLVIFTIMALIPILLLYPKPVSPQRLSLTILLLVVLVRAGYMIAVFLFSPRNPRFRFSGLDGESSRFFFKWFIAIDIVMVINWELSTTLEVVGASEQGILFMRTLAGIIVYVMFVMAAWINRTRLIRFNSGTGAGPEGPTSAFMGAGAPALNLAFIIYMSIVWVLWQANLLLGGGFGRTKALMSLLVIPVYIIFTRLGMMVLHASFSKKIVAVKPGEEEHEQYSSPGEDSRERRRKYLRAGENVIRVVFAVFGIGFILKLWGVDPFKGKVLEACFNIFMSCLLAYLAWMYIESFIDRRINSSEAAGPHAMSDEGAGGALSTDRRHTLYPLLRKFIGVVLLVTVSLIILSSIGIKIVPLLASAGIFGLAIGLGSQTLVKDVVSGIFFLIDDAFRVGDYITIGDSEGTVEKTSLRALTLRHYKGQVQILTYGDIKSVTNWSRGPMLVKFDLPLTVDTDAKKVKKIIREINARMMEEEEYGPNLVEPIKAQGVKSIRDGVMTIRVKFSAKPGTQFVIRREAFRRIHAALIKAGISFASRAVTVHVPQEPAGKPGGAAPGQEPEFTTIDQNGSFFSTGAAAGAVISEPDDENK